MRIQHRYLTFDKNDKLVKLLDKINAPYIVKEKNNDATTHFYVLEFLLYEDDAQFIDIKEALNKFKIEPQIGTVYEKSDIENANWFIINSGEYQYPQPEDDFGYLAATFNLDNYCSLCGMEKIQNAPYRLRTEPKQPNNQFWGLHWEFDSIFVRQKTKDILENENVKGIRFSAPVLHKTNIAIESFFQLHIDTILETGFDNYNAKIITCKIDNEEGLNNDKETVCCGRQKFHHPRIGGYLFDKSIFNHNYDIVQTKEYFGSGRSACRLQIVSKQIKKLVEINKLKGLYFIPIVHDKFLR